MAPGLSSRQPRMPPVMKKLSPWQLLIFNGWHKIIAICNNCAGLSVVLLLLLLLLLLMMMNSNIVQFRPRDIRRGKAWSTHCALCGIDSKRTLAVNLGLLSVAHYARYNTLGRNKTLCAQLSNSRNSSTTCAVLLTIFLWLARIPSLRALVRSPILFRHRMLRHCESQTPSNNQVTLLLLFVLLLVLLLVIIMIMIIIIITIIIIIHFTECLYYKYHSKVKRRWMDAFIKTSWTIHY